VGSAGLLCETGGFCPWLRAVSLRGGAWTSGESCLWSASAACMLVRAGVRQESGLSSHARKLHSSEKEARANLHAPRCLSAMPKFTATFEANTLSELLSQIKGVLAEGNSVGVGAKKPSVGEAGGVAKAGGKAAKRKRLRQQAAAAVVAAKHAKGGDEEAAETSEKQVDPSSTKPPKKDKPHRKSLEGKE
uniref:MRG domain-containing protein n=1 Tax=Globodera pallida TaxID=36090 RepID=A0A183BHC3_GLOPA